MIFFETWIQPFINQEYPLDFFTYETNTFHIPFFFLCLNESEFNFCHLERKVQGPNFDELSEGDTCHIPSFTDSSVHVLLVTLKLTLGVSCRRLRNKAITAFLTIITSQHLASSDLGAGFKRCPFVYSELLTHVLSLPIS